MKRRFATAAIAAAMLTTGLLIAGPLSPPAGPVGSTYKTLQEIEPRLAINAANTPGDVTSVYRITAPGSYYLAGDVTGVSGKHGIQIAASDVTIDLNGFGVVGVPGAMHGITGTAGQSRISIRNGTVRQWPQIGVEMHACKSVLLEQLHAGGCTMAGIRVGEHSMVSLCVSSQNAGQGISIGNRSTVQECVTSDNYGGTTVGFASRALRCLASGNKGSGFEGEEGAVLEGCQSFDNDGAGILVTTNATVTGCTAKSNDYGIAFASFSTILNNTADDNAGAGFLSAFNGNRTIIKGNNATRNGQGFKVLSSNNLVLGNSCALNDVNFVIAANNHVAKILTLPFSPAINGSTGGSTVSDPDANYAY